MEHTGSSLCYRLLSNKEQDLNGHRAWEKHFNLLLCALLQTEKAMGSSDGSFNEERKG